ncbi:hypothetical protein EV363DRAFT_1293134 [Boletus edulis]|nr:hypothetical protein EV363DRAFT_1293134 [Boletus edulis]
MSSAVCANEEFACSNTFCLRPLPEYSTFLMRFNLRADQHLYALIRTATFDAEGDLKLNIHHEKSTYERAVDLNGMPVAATEIERLRVVVMVIQTNLIIVEALVKSGFANGTTALGPLTPTGSMSNLKRRVKCDTKSFMSMSDANLSACAILRDGRWVHHSIEDANGRATCSAVVIMAKQLDGHITAPSNPHMWVVPSSGPCSLNVSVGEHAACRAVIRGRAQIKDCIDDIRFWFPVSFKSISELFRRRHHDLLESRLDSQTCISATKGAFTGLTMRGGTLALSYWLRRRPLQPLRRAVSRALPVITTPTSNLRAWTVNIHGDVASSESVYRPIKIQVFKTTSMSEKTSSTRRNGTTESTGQRRAMQNIGNKYLD